jgi:hypothetical protein
MERVNDSSIIHCQLSFYLIAHIAVTDEAKCARVCLQPCDLHHADKPPLVLTACSAAVVQLTPAQFSWIQRACHGYWRDLSIELTANKMRCDFCG